MHNPTCTSTGVYAYMHTFLFNFTKMQSSEITHMLLHMYDHTPSKRSAWNAPRRHWNATKTAAPTGKRSSRTMRKRIFSTDFLDGFFDGFLVRKSPIFYTDSYADFLSGFLLQIHHRILEWIYRFVLRKFPWAVRRPWKHNVHPMNRWPLKVHIAEKVSFFASPECARQNSTNSRTSVARHFLKARTTE